MTSASFHLIAPSILWLDDVCGFVTGHSERNDIMGLKATRGHREKVFIQENVLDGEHENNWERCREANDGINVVCMNPSCPLQQDARNTQEGWWESQRKNPHRPWNWRTQTRLSKKQLPSWLILSRSAVIGAQIDCGSQMMMKLFLLIIISPKIKKATKALGPVEVGSQEVFTRALFRSSTAALFIRSPWRFMGNITSRMTWGETSQRTLLWFSWSRWTPGGQTSLPLCHAAWGFTNKPAVWRRLLQEPWTTASADVRHWSLHKWVKKSRIVGALPLQPELNRTSVCHWNCWWKQLHFGKSSQISLEGFDSHQGYI